MGRWTGTGRAKEGNFLRVMCVKTHQTVTFMIHILKNAFFTVEAVMTEMAIICKRNHCKQSLL